MRRLLYPVLAVMAGLASGNANAVDAFDWSGFYVGGALGVVQSGGSADIVTDGSFAGPGYDHVNDSPYFTLGSLPPWPTQAELSRSSGAGMGFAGAQMQVGGLVLGGEVRGVLGDFGSAFNDSWSGDVSDSARSGTTTYSGTVWQDISLTFGTSYDSYVAPVARLGVAADRFLLFALAGPAVARVTATTSASVDETGRIVITSPGFRATIDRRASPSWSGTSAETLLGYTIGAGVDYAATDDVILRLEASVTNLGSIAVTGVSEASSTTYTVTQPVGNFAVMAGASIKF